MEGRGRGRRVEKEEGEEGLHERTRRGRMLRKRRAGSIQVG